MLMWKTGVKGSSNQQLALSLRMFKNEIKVKDISLERQRRPCRYTT
jgi:hypothetical protein